MKKITFLTLIFVALFVFPQMKALACTCVQIGNETLEQEIKAQLKNDKAVFVGKVIEINDRSEQGNRLVKFQVEQFWKGGLSEEITIASDKSRSSCAYPFEKGKSYLIFAVTYNNNLFTGLCMSNREISKAAEELKILGKGTKPKKDKFQIKQN